MKQVTQRFKVEELAIVRDFMREAKEVFERQISGWHRARRSPQGSLRVPPPH